MEIPCTSTEKTQNLNMNVSSSLTMMGKSNLHEPQDKLTLQLNKNVQKKSSEEKLDNLSMSKILNNPETNLTKIREKTKCLVLERPSLKENVTQPSSKGKVTLISENKSSETGNNNGDEGNLSPHGNIFEKISALSTVSSTVVPNDVGPIKKRGRPPKSGKLKSTNLPLLSKRSFGEKEKTCKPRKCLLSLHNPLTCESNSTSNQIFHLDNKESNISPDSGIQSVGYSPYRGVSLETQTPLSPQHNKTHVDNVPYSCSSRLGIDVSAMPTTTSSISPAYSCSSSSSNYLRTESEKSLEMFSGANYSSSSPASSGSPSPGKKKGRGRPPKQAEFLRLHKSSTLLNQGKVPRQLEIPKCSEADHDSSIEMPTLSPEILNLMGEDPTTKLFGKEISKPYAVKNFLAKQISSKARAFLGAVKKRGPGRPKGSKNMTTKRSKMKRGPGRPPKVLDPSIVKMKRRPGRPKGSPNKKTLLKLHQHKLKDVYDFTTTVDLLDDEEYTYHVAGDYRSHIKHMKAKSKILTKTKSKYGGLFKKEKIFKMKRKPGRPRKILPIVEEKTKQPENVQSYEKLCEDTDLNYIMQSVKDVTANFPDSNLTDFNLEDDLETIIPTMTHEPPSHEDRTLPKIRKPKLHVMMRKDKHRRKKKTKKNHSSLTQKSGFYPNRVYFPSKFRLASPKSPLGLVDKSSNLRTSRSSLESNGSTSSVQSSTFIPRRDILRKMQQRRRSKLLYFKSKHKNIVDPVFISDMEYVVNNFHLLAISNPEKNFIRVKPGEVPLPTIFKIPVINVSKKKEIKSSPLFEIDKLKKSKVIRDFSYIEKWIRNEKLKGIRKKSFFEEQSPTSSEDSMICKQQCLPPKKRHRLFNSDDPCSSDVSIFDQEDGFRSQERKKPGRPRKNPLPLVSFRQGRYKIQ